MHLYEKNEWLIIITQIGHDLNSILKGAIRKVLGKRDREIIVMELSEFVTRGGKGTGTKKKKKKQKRETKQ